MENKYLKLEDLEVYQIARELSRSIWNIYNSLNSEMKYIFGRQYITAVDSIGANVAEGYGRYHFLDKAKFYYNARASLFESKHWTNLLYEREILSEKDQSDLINKLDFLNAKLNNLIKITIKNK
ncbi:four helix bundle protein [Candidatus Falkowbacteria bacterium]|nr:four helix bundle protein [Candidatus Falkowbacteria bacterium]